MPRTPAFSANLDLLRAVAVLCVFFSHLFESLGAVSFGSLGRFGVVIFFVHTSYVLMGSLQRLQRSSESNAGLVVAFWIRRFFRIYPLAVFFVVLAVVCRIPASPGEFYSWIGVKAFLSNLALTQNLTNSRYILSPLWSLPLEVQMYVLLPFAYLAVSGDKRYRSKLLWALSVLLALTVPHMSGRLNVFRYAPCFVSGIIAYDLVLHRRRRPRLPAWIWPVGILLLIVLFGPHDNQGLQYKMPRAWVLSLALGVLYANVEELSWGRMQPIFHWIAEHSYGIYLSHCVILWIALDRMPHAAVWVRALMLIGGITGASALLYVSIERPLILAGGHIARRWLRPHSSNKARELV
jgi:peptidoglycan/LPS O-acetylase OafA/YrhL